MPSVVRVFEKDDWLLHYLKMVFQKQRLCIKYDADINMNGDNQHLEGDGPDLFQDAIPALAWRDWGQPQ